MHILLDFDKIKAAAQENGIDMVDLARSARVNPSTLSRMKRGTGNIRTLVKLNMALFDQLKARRDTADRLLKLQEVAHG